jgi:ketosteroid isomerase-like protein
VKEGSDLFRNVWPLQQERLAKPVGKRALAAKLFEERLNTMTPSRERSAEKDAATRMAMTKDQAAIRSILADHARAHFAKDVDLSLAHSAEGFMSFDLDPPLLHKGDAAKARQAIEAWFATWKSPIALEYHDLAVTAGADVAFSTSLTHMTGTKTDGAEVSLWFRSTNGFRKENGAWKIVHSHSSVPFYMDGSFKACVDLKP